MTTDGPADPVPLPSWTPPLDPGPWSSGPVGPALRSPSEPLEVAPHLGGVEEAHHRRDCSHGAAPPGGSGGQPAEGSPKGFRGVAQRPEDGEQLGPPAAGEKGERAERIGGEPG